MLASYGLIGLFLVVVILFTLLMVLIPVLLKFARIVPSKPSPVKNSTFECGMQTIGKSWVQFNFRYYFYALIFLALDVIVVFLYPWAVYLRKLGAFSLVAVLILVAIIFVGYIYAWKKRVLEWK